MEAAQLCTPTTTSNSVYGNGKTSSLCSIVLHVEGDQRKKLDPSLNFNFEIGGMGVRKSGQQKSVVKY